MRFSIAFTRKSIAFGSENFFGFRSVENKEWTLIQYYTFLDVVAASFSFLSYLHCNTINGIRIEFLSINSEKAKREEKKRMTKKVSK
jgi:hypothetical protein